MSVNWLYFSFFNHKLTSSRRWLYNSFIISANIIKSNHYETADETKMKKVMCRNINMNK